MKNCKILDGFSVFDIVRGIVIPKRISVEGKVACDGVYELMNWQSCCDFICKRIRSGMPLEQVRNTQQHAKLVVFSGHAVQDLYKRLEVIWSLNVACIFYVEYEILLTQFTSIWRVVELNNQNSMYIEHSTSQYLIWMC